MKGEEEVHGREGRRERGEEETYTATDQWENHHQYMKCACDMLTSFNVPNSTFISLKSCHHTTVYPHPKDEEVQWNLFSPDTLGTLQIFFV